MVLVVLVLALLWGALALRAADLAAEERRRCVLRVVDKVGHESSETPVVARVPEEVHDWHRRVAEAVDREGLHDALGEVEAPVGAGESLHLGPGNRALVPGVEHLGEEVEERVDCEGPKVLPEEHRFVSDLRPEVLEDEHGALADVVVRQLLAGSERGPPRLALLGLQGKALPGRVVLGLG